MMQIHLNDNTIYKKLNSYWIKNVTIGVPQVPKIVRSKKTNASTTFHLLQAISVVSLDSMNTKRLKMFEIILQNNMKFISKLSNSKLDNGYNLCFNLCNFIE